MDVKNPTGGTINYAFAGLSLTPGQTATIDDSFNDNLDFQLAKQNNTIIIVKYEPGQLTYNFSLEVNEDVNTPSNDQKGALVASNSPSATNKFLTMLDNYQVKDIKIKYVSATSVGLESVKSDKVVINSTLYSVNLAATIDLITTSLLDSNGAIVAGPIGANTLYYIYYGITNQLFPSTVAPSMHSNSLYLNSNKNWLFVGWMYTNASSQLASKMSLLNYYDKSSDVKTVSGLSGNVSGNAGTFKAILGTDEKVLLAKGWKVSVQATFGVFSAVASEKLEYAVGTGTNKTWEDKSILTETHYGAGSYVYEETASTPTMQVLNLYFKGPSTNHSCDSSTVKMEVTRWT